MNNSLKLVRTINDNMIPVGTAIIHEDSKIVAWLDASQTVLAPGLFPMSRLNIDTGVMCFWIPDDIIHTMNSPF